VVSFEETIVPPTLGGSYVYMANTAAGLLGMKAYPYFPAPPPRYVEFKRFTLDEAVSLDLEAHCREVLKVYDPFVHRRRFPAVLFGAPNGGIVNLAVAMGLPYLCSQFRIPILLQAGERMKDLDDLELYARVTENVGERWTARHRWGTVSCLVDPIHDRMDLGQYAHVREKFTQIPPAFEKFLSRHLLPNGTVILVNATYPWVSHRIEERVYLQVGGLGGISADEYLTGSERVNLFLKLENSEHQDGWQLEGYSKVRRPESEWGTEPELKASVQEFCNKNGYGLLLLEQNHPAGFNLLATHALYKKHTADGGSCGGYSVNIFWGLCPALMLRARLLGCWFTFTDRASLKISEQQLRTLIDDFPDVTKRAVMGYYWSYPRAKLLDVVPPSGWLNMLSKYIPRENIRIPGLTDLERTEHDIFQYEDALFQESKKFEGKESRYNVSVEDLKDLLR
jgi:hypothetical protein